MRELRIEEEAWGDLWPVAEPLTRLHSAEVDIEPRRPLRPDVELLEKLAALGVLRALGARLGSELIGYITWQISPDIESQGLLIANQGPWFVLPGYPRVAWGLYDASISMLRVSGVSCIFPHHRLQGRGAELGKFLLRQGAKPLQQHYIQWIGD